MATEALIFKGTGRGTRRELAISIPHDMALDEVLAELRARLRESQGFFEGSPVHLQGRPLSDAERRSIGSLVEEFGMSLMEPKAEAEGARPAGNGAVDGGGRGRNGDGGRARGEKERDSSVDMDAEEHWPVAEAPPDDRTLLVRRTLRSGQRVYYAGNVVVLGDVNPGAVVTCTGDIVVMGRLRGVAHAGAGGNAGARVMALRLQPTQLRIAHFISRAPDDAHDGPSWPEVAVISNGVIEIQAFTP